MPVQGQEARRVAAPRFEVPPCRCRALSGESFRPTLWEQSLVLTELGEPLSATRGGMGHQGGMGGQPSMGPTQDPNEGIDDFKL